MKNKNLLGRLSALGFPLFEVEDYKNANLTIADVVKSKDLRFWEGFPVLLANSVEGGLFNYKEVGGYIKRPLDKLCFASLIGMSLALYRVLNLKFSWADNIYNSFSAREKKEFNKIFEKIKYDRDFQIAEKTMSSQRLKTTFNNYFSKKRSDLNELLSAKQELGVEYALSQFFSPKQKELFFKKLKREKLTKTEKEYFSRVVKKKILALSNPELHRLARQLLE